VSLVVELLPAHPTDHLLFSAAIPPTNVDPLSLHDALPICRGLRSTSNVDSIDRRSRVDRDDLKKKFFSGGGGGEITKSFSERSRDRKSTRLNSSHVSISYAVFCLNKKIDRTCYTLYNPLHR